MILDGRRLESGSQLVTDVCIIGAGQAGIALASELDGSGLDVCLLESGGPGIRSADGLPQRLGFLRRRLQSTQWDTQAAVRRNIQHVDGAFAAPSEQSHTLPAAQRDGTSSVANGSRTADGHSEEGLGNPIRSIGEPTRCAGSGRSSMTRRSGLTEMLLRCRSMTVR